MNSSSGAASSVDLLCDEILGRPEDEGVTLALAVAVNGEMVSRRYGRQPDTPFGPGGPVDHSTTFISWSMAKSIVHALVGIAIDDGLLELDTPMVSERWRDDGRSSITLDHLLQMRSGLAFVEEYVDGETSDTIEMLFSGSEHRGVDDMGDFAAAKPALADPGDVFSYSSGTTNIICRLLGDRLAGGGVDEVGAERRRAAVEEFARTRLFNPIGMHSATMRFDASGTFIGSSFVYATLDDFVRFGELYRLDGVTADGRRVLPEGWRNLARERISHDPDGAGPHGFDYGRHWWIWPDLEGSMAAHGYQGQFTLVLPEAGVTLVHLGLTDVAVAPVLVERLGSLARVATGL